MVAGHRAGWCTLDRPSAAAGVVDAYAAPHGGGRCFRRPRRVRRDPPIDRRDRSADPCRGARRRHGRPRRARQHRPAAARPRLGAGRARAARSVAEPVVRPRGPAVPRHRARRRRRMDRGLAGVGGGVPRVRVPARRRHRRARNRRPGFTDAGIAVRAERGGGRRRRGAKNLRDARCVAVLDGGKGDADRRAGVAGRHQPAAAGRVPRGNPSAATGRSAVPQVHVLEAHRAGAAGDRAGAATSQADDAGRRGQRRRRDRARRARKSRNAERAGGAPAAVSRRRCQAATAVQRRTGAQHPCGAAQRRGADVRLPGVDRRLPGRGCIGRGDHLRQCVERHHGAASAARRWCKDHSQRAEPALPARREPGSTRGAGKQSAAAQQRRAVAARLGAGGAVRAAVRKQYRRGGRAHRAAGRHVAGSRLHHLAQRQLRRLRARARPRRCRGDVPPRRGFLLGRIPADAARGFRADGRLRRSLRPGLLRGRRLLRAPAAAWVARAVRARCGGAALRVRQRRRYAGGFGTAAAQPGDFSCAAPGVVGDAAPRCTEPSAGGAAGGGRSAARAGHRRPCAAPASRRRLSACQRFSARPRAACPRHLVSDAAVCRVRMPACAPRCLPRSRC